MFKLPENLIALDFETYTEKKSKYSLKAKGMGLSDYIRHEKFHAHGASIRTNRMRKAKWIPHEKLASELKKYDWANSALLCHNTAFDGAVLNWHYDLVPSFYLDTLSMARPLFDRSVSLGLDSLSKYLGYEGKVDNKIIDRIDGLRDIPPDLYRELVEYGLRDTDELWSVYHDLKKQFPMDELILIHLSIKAFVEPVVVVNTKKAKVELDAEIKDKQELLTRCQAILGVSSNEEVDTVLQSNDKLLIAFAELGVAIPTKISKRTGKEAPQLAKDDLGFQALAEHEDQRVRDLAAARLGAKSSIGEDRARRVYERGLIGPLPIMLNYCRARTFRWSGGDLINPQNFPTRQGRTGLRHCLEAPRGEVFCIVDSSQIEARTLAWLAGQEDLVQTFASGGDPYIDMAERIYGRKIVKNVDKEERFVGKVAVLALGYKQAAKGFQSTLASGSMGPKVQLPLPVCQKAVNAYRLRNDFIVDFWRTASKILRCISGMTHDHIGYEVDGHLILDTDTFKLWMPNGLALHYRDLKWKGGGSYAYRDGKTTFHVYDGKLTENIVQSLARIIVGQQMIKIAEKYHVVSMAHDEVVYTAPKNKARQALEFGLEQLRTPPDWCKSLPLDGEGIYDKAYIKPP